MIQRTPGAKRRNSKTNDIVDSICEKTAGSIQYKEVISVIFPAKNMQGQV